MADKRTFEREKCYAKILLLPDEIPGYVRDLSGKGIRIEIPVPVRYEKDSEIQAIIIPIEDLEILPIQCRLVIRWQKSESIYTTIGAEIKSLKDTAAASGFRTLGTYFSAD